MDYPQGGYRPQSSAPPGSQGMSDAELYRSAIGKTDAARAFRGEFGDVLRRPFRGSMGESAPNRVPDFRPRSARGPSAKDMARLSKGLRPPWMSMGQFAAEKYFEWYRKNQRGPMTLGPMMFPGYEMYASCNARPEYYDGVRGYHCYEVQGAGAYIKNAPPVDQYSHIQTWEWISETGQGPDGLQWGKAAESWRPIQGWPQTGWPGPGRYASPYIDPNMMDWPAHDPARFPEGWTNPKPRPHPWPQEDPKPWTQPHPMPMPDPLPQQDPFPWVAADPLTDVLTEPWPVTRDQDRYDPPPPETFFRPPPKKTKEIKLKFHLGYKAVLSLFNTASEARDFIEALWKALPSKCRTKTAQMKVPKHKRKYQRLGKQRPDIMISDLLRCAAPYGKVLDTELGAYRFDETAQEYWGRAIDNLVENEAKDRAFGAYGQVGKAASKYAKPHGRLPVGFQRGAGYGHSF